MAQQVKNLPEMQETQDTWVRSLGWEDPLEKEMANKGISEKLCFIDYVKACDCVDHNKLWKILQEMGIPNHLTCLQRNPYAD